MQSIVLPNITIRSDAKGIHIKHHRTGAKTVSSVKKLETWALQQLRKDMQGLDEKEIK
jgi:hypothetical protein